MNHELHTIHESKALFMQTLSLPSSGQFDGAGCSACLNPVTIEYNNNVCILQVQTKDHRQCTCAQNNNEELCDFWWWCSWKNNFFGFSIFFLLLIFWFYYRSKCLLNILSIQSEYTSGSWLNPVWEVRTQQGIG